MLIRHAHARGMGQTELLMPRLSAVFTLCVDLQFLLFVFTFSTHTFYADIYKHLLVVQ